MRHNKPCSEALGPGWARRKDPCQRQEAIKPHSVPRGLLTPRNLRGCAWGRGRPGRAARWDLPHPCPSGLPSRSTLRGHGGRGDGRPRPSRPAERLQVRPEGAAPRRGASAVPRGARRGRRGTGPAGGSRAAQGCVKLRGSLRCRGPAVGWAFVGRVRDAAAPTARSRVTCPRCPPSGPPGLGAVLPPGARQGPAPPPAILSPTASSRRRRCRTSLAAFPARERDPPPRRPPLPAPAPGPQPRPTATGEAHRRAGSTAALWGSSPWKSPLYLQRRGLRPVPGPARILAAPPRPPRRAATPGLTASAPPPSRPPERRRCRAATASPPAPSAFSMCPPSRDGGSSFCPSPAAPGARLPPPSPGRDPGGPRAVPALARHSHGPRAPLPAPRSSPSSPAAPGSRRRCPRLMSGCGRRRPARSRASAAAGSARGVLRARGLCIPTSCSARAGALG